MLAKSIHNDTRHGYVANDGDRFWRTNKLLSRDSDCALPDMNHAAGEIDVAAAQRSRFTEKKAAQSTTRFMERCLSGMAVMRLFTVDGGAQGGASIAG